MLRRLFSRRSSTVPFEHGRFRRSAQVTQVDHGEKTVLLDARSEQFFSLDETGRRIWGIIAGPSTAAEVVATLRQTFDVPADQIAADVAAFLNDLERERLIEVVR
jgi:Coenzyme PQQ synthesis protein D (PqqD)